MTTPQQLRDEADKIEKAERVEKAARMITAGLFDMIQSAGQPDKAEQTMESRNTLYEGLQLMAWAVSP